MNDPLWQHRGAAVRLAEADALRRSGEPARALAVLGPLAAPEDTAPLPCDRVHAMLLTARIHADSGDAQGACTALETALQVAEPDVMMVAFTMVDVADLLAAHPAHETAHGAFRDAVVDFLASRVGGPAHREIAESLTPSESRVLGFLPTNLTTRQIADEMYLSVNTVKVHLRGIYQKLDAHTRTEAVHQARSAGLLAVAYR